MYFIFNNTETGRQQAGYFESELGGNEILWQGESVEAFEEETGFTIAQLGGFKLVEGKLTFSQALKDAHDAPQIVPQTPQEKLQIITSMISQLDDQKQADLLQGTLTGAFIALNAGNTSVAKLVVDAIPTGDDEELKALKTDVITILEA